MAKELWQHDDAVDGGCQPQQVAHRLGLRSQARRRRREVERRAYARRGDRHGAREHLGDAEVAQFANSVLSDENVLGLDISMQDVLIVHRHDCHDNMGEGAQNLGSSELGLRLNATLDELI